MQGSRRYRTPGHQGLGRRPPDRPGVVAKG